MTSIPIVYGDDKTAREQMTSFVRRNVSYRWQGTKDDFRQLLPLSLEQSTPSYRLPGVTVVIPTNGNRVAGLQKFLEQVEKVVLLSNGTGQLWYPQATTKRVLWEGHGKTRARALEYIDTPYVFFSVDDAIPLPSMLVKLVKELERGQWDALCPRQIPWPDAHPITRRRLHEWMPYRNEPYAISQCDHVGTLYRTDFLHQFPIPDVPIAEDAWWSIGKHVGCHPEACILHSHRRLPLSLYKRERAIHEQLAKLGRIQGPPSSLAVLNAFIQNAARYGLTEGITSCAEALGQRHGWFRYISRRQPRP